MNSFIKPKKSKKVVIEQQIKNKKPEQEIIRKKSTLGKRPTVTDLLIPRQVFKNVNVIEKKSVKT